MLPKPKHLTREYAEQFQDQSVVDAYHLRPPYPAEVFVILADLIAPQCRCVLDIGCGTGEIARRIASSTTRVDAVDLSPAMIEKGRGLPGGDRSNLCWICGAVEEAPLTLPYGLVTAAASLHWMDWDVALPRFHQALSSGGCLAIIEDSVAPTDCRETFWDLVRRCSTNQDYRPYDLVEELTHRNLFVKQGERRIEPVNFRQPIKAYVESFHARNGFSRQRMSTEAAATFDTEARELLWADFPDGEVNLNVQARVVWGKPCLPGEPLEENS